MTDTSSEDSRSTKKQQQTGRQGAAAGKQDSQSDWTAAATGSSSDSSVKDLRTELALEMSKFIEDIEHQLEHVVPMANLCFVRDSLVDRRSRGH